jgi:hypothetical protein
MHTSASGRVKMRDLLVSSFSAIFVVRVVQGGMRSFRAVRVAVVRLMIGMAVMMVVGLLCA